MFKLMKKYAMFIVILSTIAACAEPGPSVDDLHLPFAKYEPDPSQESIGVGATIEFFNETDNAVDTYGHLKVSFHSSFLEEYRLTRDDRVHFEIKGTDITGTVSERVRANLTDLPQDVLQTIDDEEPLTVLVHISDELIAEIALIYRTPSIPSI
ncbi:hypothetical protein [Desertibacillus haloalkaliphilus]|uniref:hypothetical protein n=1 Tax=Desertibacillus haloalkaliphilus TaxID=1328930 RepID=UPI001C2649D0|nr:hypothetical protein [Desertibacillus haloalkaliphilus]MBU8907509.1 hypothetical protein [Desertibacillus haloalkaliphilus]